MKERTRLAAASIMITLVLAGCSYWVAKVVSAGRRAEETTSHETELKTSYAADEHAASKIEADETAGAVSSASDFYAPTESSGASSEAPAVPHSPPPPPTSSQAPASLVSEDYYTPARFKRLGVINWNGWRWTWYSQRVLPGGGLKIPGRHVDAGGYVCDGDGFICLSSSILASGTVLDTPLGKRGKIYDCGCPANTIDVYVAW